MRGWTRRQEAGRVPPRSLAVWGCLLLTGERAELVHVEDAASTGASRPACGSEGICPLLSGAWLQVRFRW